MTVQDSFRQFGFSQARASGALADEISRSSYSLALAQRYLQQRSLRRAVFDADLFREPAWDIMLDLYCARLSGKDVSIMDACIAAGVPTTTGLRHVRRLLASNLVTRRHDAGDRRRSLVVLSDAAATKIEAWLQATWPGLTHFVDCRDTLPNRANATG